MLHVPLLSIIFYESSNLDWPFVFTNNISLLITLQSCPLIFWIIRKLCSIILIYYEYWMKGKFSGIYYTLIITFFHVFFIKSSCLISSDLWMFTMKIMVWSIKSLHFCIFYLLLGQAVLFLTYSLDKQFYF